MYETIFDGEAIDPGMVWSIFQVKPILTIWMAVLGLRLLSKCLRAAGPAAIYLGPSDFCNGVES